MRDQNPAPPPRKGQIFTIKWKNKSTQPPSPSTLHHPPSPRPHGTSLSFQDHAPGNLSPSQTLRIPIIRKHAGIRRSTNRAPTPPNPTTLPPPRSSASAQRRSSRSRHNHRTSPRGSRSNQRRRRSLDTRSSNRDITPRDPEPLQILGAVDRDVMAHSGTINPDQVRAVDVLGVFR